MKPYSMDDPAREPLIAIVLPPKVDCTTYMYGRSVYWYNRSVSFRSRP
jgi:hypothetical protein